MEWYRDKRVVVTGGSSGIGKSTAMLLSQWGAQCCIIGRDKQKLENALHEIRSKAAGAGSGQKLIAVPADVSDRGQMNAAAQSIVKELGGIDVLVNCAGITNPAYIDKIPR